MLNLKISNPTTVDGILMGNMLTYIPQSYASYVFPVLTSFPSMLWMMPKTNNAKKNIYPHPFLMAPTKNYTFNNVGTDFV